MVGAQLAERSLGLENSNVPDPQRFGTDPRIRTTDLDLEPTYFFSG